jgi:thiamine kinase-like enzyme
MVHAEPGLMIWRFIEGRVFTAADVYPNLERIAQFVRRFHNNMPAAISGPAFMFWVFHANRDYVRQLTGHATEDEQRNWLALNAALEQVQVPLRPIVGHHDLLPANLIDDGKRLWLLDYEYAGYGTAMFDLANLSSNSSFEPAQSEELLEAYFLEAPGEALKRSHAAMECASLLREALWSLVSFNHLDAPGADYIGYARQNFERLDAALAGYRERFGDPSSPS